MEIKVNWKEKDKIVKDKIEFVNNAWINLLKLYMNVIKDKRTMSDSYMNVIIKKLFNEDNLLTCKMALRLLLIIFIYY